MPRLVGAAGGFLEQFLPLMPREAPRLPIGARVFAAVIEEADVVVLLLERLENAARENDAAPAIVLSGTVYAFEGRSYLLPSSFRRAREGRGIGG